MLKIGNKGVSPVVGTILLIAITVALAAVVATLVSGLGGRGAPPNALLAVKAVKTGTGTTYDLVISHEGGDDLSVSDLQIQASNSDNTTQVLPFLYNGATSGTFAVGNVTTISRNYTGNCENKVLQVFIIHKPSKQKIFSSSTVAVQLS